MNDQEWLNLALASIHSGQWFGWKKDYTGSERMTYENVIVIKDGITKPTEADVNAKIQELKDAETQKANDKISAQNKLKALGLTDAEIEAL
jgi:hypothetical protein